MLLQSRSHLARTTALQLLPLKTGTSRPGLSFRTIQQERLALQQKQTNTEGEAPSLPLATFSCCCTTSSFGGKSQREKYKAFFTSPWKQIFNYECSLYNSASPAWRSQKPMLSEMTKNPQVQSRWLISTHLRMAEGQGTTEEPYGINIRPRAQVLGSHFFRRRKRIATNSFKDIIPNHSNRAG